MAGDKEEEKVKQDSTHVPPPTAAEVLDNILLDRCRHHVRQWWPKYAEAIEPPDFDFLIEDQPYELWSGTFLLRDKAAPHSTSEKSLWFLWSGDEVTSYDNVAAALTRPLISSPTETRQTARC
jgi:hypothetical protein